MPSVPKVMELASNTNVGTTPHDVVALERSIKDNLSVGGETFRGFVKNFYQDNNLVRGEFRFGNRRVDLCSISCVSYCSPPRMITWSRRARQMELERALDASGRYIDDDRRRPCRLCNGWQSPNNTLAHSNVLVFKPLHDVSYLVSQANPGPVAAK